MCSTLIYSSPLFSSKTSHLRDKNIEAKHEISSMLFSSATWFDWDRGLLKMSRNIKKIGKICKSELGRGELETRNMTCILSERRLFSKINHWMTYLPGTDVWLSSSLFSFVFLMLLLDVIITTTAVLWPITPNIGTVGNLQRNSLDYQSIFLRLLLNSNHEELIC